ncbi:MAG: endonuclease domain-containing protein [Xanthomonadales bacterium]|nr:endonuclease domain-containing protein [Xanthomonadales bacterium]
MKSKSGRLPRVNRFCFGNHHFDPASGTATLTYSFDEGAELEERIVFPYQPWPSDPSRQAAFLRALEILHVVAGVSYWKSCVPPEMDLGGIALDDATASFFHDLYVYGLAEFAWNNDIELEGRVSFKASGTPAAPLDLDLPSRSLLAMGGGKDSLVSLEILRKAGHEFQPVCVGGSSLIADTVQAAGLPLVRIERLLAPQLAQMNDAGALNGHVPVTAINSAILVCAALLYGYRNIVFSNESSASEATFTDRSGRAVNHQWSKSLEFEQGFQKLLAARVSPDVAYFSLLRPLNELSIAQRFSHLTRYHGVFSSCNRNFHLEGSRIEGRWCGNCPKCRFTSLALAPFMNPGQLSDITGHDLLNDPEQEAGFRALCNLGADKPLECVGSVDESRAAIKHLADDPSWQGHHVVRVLAKALQNIQVPSMTGLLDARSEHCISDQELVDALA